MVSCNDFKGNGYYIRAHIPHYSDCLTEQELGTFWDKMRQDGRDKIVFYDGQIASKAAFIEFMQNSENYVYAVMKDKELLCLAWINNFIGRCGMIHFTMFYKSVGQEQSIGSFLLNFLLFSRVGEKYCFDALYGLTPKVYRHVFPLIQKLGFRLVIDIPSSVFFQKKGKKCFKNAVFSIVTRETCNYLI
ncbi:MAG: hypothetical protein MI749_10285 [Desulfovibrionales bacterium]|nr:hypothetical protein [Desulfovibrionales bacterium]